MDLSMIQTHLDNFVDTWEGWGKILGNVGSFFQNTIKVFDFLSSEPEASDFFPGTSSLITENK